MIGISRKVTFIQLFFVLPSRGPDTGILRFWQNDRDSHWHQEMLKQAKTNECFVNEMQFYHKEFCVTRVSGKCRKIEVKDLGALILGGKEEIVGVGPHAEMPFGTTERWKMKRRKKMASACVPSRTGYYHWVATLPNYAFRSMALVD